MLGWSPFWLFSPIVVFQHENGREQLLESFWVQEPGKMPLLYRLVVAIGVLNFPLCIFSRMYIIVETFISLRHVEMEVLSDGGVDGLDPTYIMLLLRER